MSTPPPESCRTSYVNSPRDPAVPFVWTGAGRPTETSVCVSNVCSGALPTAETGLGYLVHHSGLIGAHEQGERGEGEQEHEAHQADKSTGYREVLTEPGRQSRSSSIAIPLPSNDRADSMLLPLFAPGPPHSDGQP